MYPSHRCTWQPIELKPSIGRGGATEVWSSLTSMQGRGRVELAQPPCIQLAILVQGC